MYFYSDLFATACNQYCEEQEQSRGARGSLRGFKRVESDKANCTRVLHELLASDDSHTRNYCCGLCFLYCLQLWAGGRQGRFVLSHLLLSRP
jgi:hypothetical protein